MTMRGNTLDIHHLGAFSVKVMLFCLDSPETRGSVALSIIRGEGRGKARRKEEGQLLPYYDLGRKEGP